MGEIEISCIDEIKLTKYNIRQINSHSQNILPVDIVHILEDNHNPEDSQEYQQVVHTFLGQVEEVVVPKVEMTSWIVDFRT